MAEKQRSRGVAALEVFAGGACYGANATAYKLAYASGFTWPQVVAGQMWFALALFGIAVVAGMAFGRRWVRLGAKRVLKLLGLGMLTCLTSILYCFAMSRLPVAVALTLLFQFTWVGLVIQVAFTRRAPGGAQLAAVAVILAGTVLSSGVYKTGILGYDPLGLTCALLAAVSCALFVALSGRVEAPCPPAQRGVLVLAGSCLLSLTVCPDFFPSGVVLDGMAPFGLVTGLFGMLMPVLLFGLGSPHLPAGVSTVLAAAELPAGLLVSMIVLGEPVGAVQWVGVAAILAGVALSQFGDIARALKRRLGRPCENARPS